MNDFLGTPGLEVRSLRDPRRIYCAGRILLYRPDGHHVRAACGQYRIDRVPRPSLKNPDSFRIDVQDFGAFDLVGQDITDLVQNVPRDGRDHEIQCPNCGNKIMVCRT